MHAPKYRRTMSEHRKRRVDIAKLKTQLKKIASCLHYDTVDGDTVQTLRNIGTGRVAVHRRIVDAVQPHKDALTSKISALQQDLEALRKAEADATALADQKAGECARPQEALFSETMERFSEALMAARDIGNCTICQRPLEGPLCVLDTVTLQCSHVFHDECFSKIAPRYKITPGHVLRKFVYCPNCKKEHVIMDNMMSPPDDFLPAGLNTLWNQNDIPFRRLGV